jgi:hypothetical protein
MALKNNFLRFLFIMVFLWIILSIIYKLHKLDLLNIQNNFSDLGALIQLQTSRPYYYVNVVQAKQNAYDNDNEDMPNIIKPYSNSKQNVYDSISDMSIGTRELNHVFINGVSRY